MLRGHIVLQLPPLLLLLPIIVLSSPGDAAADVGGVCALTQHQSVCKRSMAPFSGTERQSPHWWARVAVSVTIAETRKVALYLARLKRSGRLGSGAVGALSDCVECFDEALRLLGGALGELRRLRRRSFGWQTSKVQTWVSAALTDEQTCLDGFIGVAAAPPAALLRGRVRKVTYLASNALAFVNNLASSGGGK
ncbi:unnamed protein product [Spirodela intermedia]|uniref:Pectinesterase inhibitor domain-containing protein n=1 Tax=Spirodela intermedia TaxID=51605 RepID=A0A7I8JY99_SPIIN|nr:unnamed protein product [Spirodela intermedia]